MTDKVSKKQLAARLADQERRLRRLEAWVAGTEYTNEEGETYYPLAVAVSSWADPDEVTRLIASDDDKGLARLIASDDPFADLPDEAVPVVAAGLMRARQEDHLAGEGVAQGEKSIFEELPPFAELPEDLAVALAGFVYDAAHRLNTDRVEAVIAALGYLAPG